MSLEMPNGNVSKAYIPPSVPGGMGKFVSASQMGASRLRQTVQPGMYKSSPLGRNRLEESFVRESPLRRGVTEHGEIPVSLGPNRFWSKNRQAEPATRVGRTNVSVNSDNLDRRKIDGATIRYGGRNNGTSTIVMNEGLNPRAYDRTLRHEMAHATPNRSSWRMHQINNTPRRMAGEEARADLASGLNHARPSPPGAGGTAYYDGARSRAAAAGYKGRGGMDKEFFRNYRNTQNTISGNSPARRLFGNPQNSSDLMMGAGVAGAAGVGAYQYANRDVSKAYIPPRVPGGMGQFVPAAQMGARRLRQTVQPGMYKPRPMGEDSLAQSFRDQGQMRRLIMERGYAPHSHGVVARGTADAINDPNIIGVPVRPNGPGLVAEEAMTIPRGAPVSRPQRINGQNVSLNIRDEMPPGTGGFAARYGGRSSGVSTVVAPSTPPPGASRAGILQHELAHATPNRSSWRMHQVLNNPAKQGAEEARADLVTGLNHTMGASGGHRSGYHAAARSRSAAKGHGMDSAFLRGYRGQQNAAAGNTVPQRLTGNPQNLQDLAVGSGVGAGVAGAGGYAYSRRQGVEKSMSLEMPNSNVSKAIRSDKPKVARYGTERTLMRMGPGGNAQANADTDYAYRSGTSLIRRRPKYVVNRGPSDSAIRTLSSSGSGNDEYFMGARGTRHGKRRKDLTTRIANSPSAGGKKGEYFEVGKRASILRPGSGAAGVASTRRNRDGVAKRIVRPIRPPATGTAPATPAPPKPTTGMLRPMAAQGPKKPRMPQAPRMGGTPRR